MLKRWTNITKKKTILSIYAFIWLCVYDVSANTPSHKNTTLVLDSISVINDNGHIQLGWSFVSEITEGYIEIHRGLGTGSFMPIAQVPFSTADYIDNGVNANTQPYNYYIVARDMGGNSFAVSDVHKSIYLIAPTFNICNQNATQFWNNYLVTTSSGQPQPLPSPFNASQLWMKQNNNDWLIVKTFDFSSTRTNAYIDEDGTYCFFIQSYNTTTGISSSSNKRCITVELLKKPEYAYIQNVSINHDNEIELTIFGDNDAPQPIFVLWKSVNSLNDFFIYDTIKQNNQTTFHIDENVDSDSNIYYYKAELLDSCQNIVLLSNISNSLLLKSSPFSKNENLLSWNNYNGWDAGINNFEIFRKRPNDSDFILINTLPSTYNSYIDFISDDEFPVANQEVFYYIKAFENDDNQYGLKEESYSNTSIVRRDIEVFIPNAFRPNSNIEINKYFKPNFGYYEPAYYEMTIINKWGNTVFKTQNINDYWDGKVSGISSPAGVYSYVIKYSYISGEIKTKIGAVTLLE